MATVMVGIDLGGTKVAIALVDANGNVVAAGRGATGITADPQATVASIATSIKELRASVAEAQVIGAGV
ncbi:MAG: ROK family protein, partial [Chloroflexi bacterium]|nr:ROK family protein [Chloroflexota bacterium]